MTEWNAAEYDRIAALQQAMAGEVLGRLTLKGSERVLDVGCGDGRITAEVASRVPAGAVVGVDASQEMVEFASIHFAAAHRDNLSFRVADARCLTFQQEFDQVISFNALHWIHEQEVVLRGIWTALRPGGYAHLRLVPSGPRRCLEQVIEQASHRARFSTAFQGTEPPFWHPEPEDYAAMATRCGFCVESVERSDHCWDFGSREAFRAFARVTFVEWTRRLAGADQVAFIEDVLDRYRSVACECPGEENCFKFYQMDAVLRRSPV